MSEYNIHIDEIRLDSFKESIKDISFSEGDVFIIDINTYGGEASEAFAIYAELIDLKELGVFIKTRVQTICASAGVVIFLAGDERVMNEAAELMIHKSNYKWGGNDKEIEYAANYLKFVDKKYKEIILENSNIEDSLLNEYMNYDKFFRAEEALELGLATEVKFLNKNKMNKKTENAIDKKSILQRVKGAILNSPRCVQKKILYTADNKEVVFDSLDESEDVKIGDSATIDGIPAGEFSDGNIVMADGSLFLFDGDRIVNIVENEVYKELQELIKENEFLKEEISGLETKLKDYSEKIKNLEGELKELKEGRETMTAEYNRNKEALERITQTMKRVDESSPREFKKEEVSEDRLSLALDYINR